MNTKILVVPIDKDGKVSGADVIMMRKYVARLTEFLYRQTSVSVVPREGGGKNLILVYQEGAEANGSQKLSTSADQGLKIFYRR